MGDGLFRIMELPWDSVLSKVDYLRVVPEGCLLVQAKQAVETGLSLKMTEQSSGIPFCGEDPASFKSLPGNQN